MSVVRSVSIDYPHEEIHEGNHYTISYSKALSAGSAVSLAITTPVGEHMHFMANMQASLGGTLYFSEGASISGGSAITVYNNNRSSSNTSGATVKANATVTTYGTTINTVIIGSNDKQTPIGGTSEQRNEYILATNTTYMIYYVANATSTYTSINNSFYVE